MRLGIVLAATGAAAVMAWAVAAAQDGFVSQGYRPAEPTSPRTVHYFSRNGSTSRQTVPGRAGSVPGVRNYYEQLFSAPEASATTSGVRTAAGSEADEASLIHARYNRSRSGGPATDIRQLAGQRADGALGASGTTAPTEAGSSFAAPASDDPFAAFERRPQGAPPIQTAEPHAAQGASDGPGLAGPAMATGIEPEARSTSRAATATPAATNAPAATAVASAAPAIRAADGPQSTVPTLPALSTDEEPLSAVEASSSGPAAVELRWEKVGEITVGRECRCELVVKNSGEGAARDVAVEAFFPSSVRLIASDPKPTTAEDHLTWAIAALPAGGEKRIAITLIPSQDGDLKVSAFVRYTEAAATTLAVREPLLQVSVSGPAEVPIGETVAQTISVSNPGTGTAEEVIVEVALPPGLEHAKGSKLAMPIGSLAPGQSQAIRLALFATQGGQQPLHVRAISGESLRHEASTSVLVAAPTLKIAAEGPGLRYVGRDAVYRIRVVNDGGAAANNVRVTHEVPESFSFVRADKGGRFEAGPSQIVWFVGRVEAGQSVELAAELTASGLGAHKHVITATGEGGARSEAIVETAVDGTASLVVQVIDLDDPIEVGAETAYEVRIRNEGTKVATNVEVACQVPAGVATLSARGPTAHQGDASLLTFAPIGQLEPGKTALYRVVVRGTAAGKHRFRVRLTSDSIDEPLIHEELTHYYAD